MSVPPLLHVPVAIGPQRLKATVPLHVVAPPMVRVAESVADAEPPPIDSVLWLATVRIPDVQLPKVARTKSFSVAVVEVGTALGRDGREAFVAETEERQVDAALIELAVQVAAVTALVDEWPWRRRSVVRVDDAAERVARGRGRALRGIGRREELEVAVHRGVPAVHGDRRCPTTVAEVADDEEVPGAVHAVEALC